MTDGGRSFIYKHILEIHQEDLEETSENPPNNQIEKLEEINAKKSKIPQNKMRKINNNNVYIAGDILKIMQYM